MRKTVLTAVGAFASLTLLLGLAGCGNNDNASATPGNGSGTSTTQSDPGSGKTSDPPKQSSGSGDNPTTLEQFEAIIKAAGYDISGANPQTNSDGVNGIYTFDTGPGVTCKGNSIKSGNLLYSNDPDIGGWKMPDGNGDSPSLVPCK